MACDSIGTTLVSASSQKGFWRADNLTGEFVSCPVPSSCEPNHTAHRECTVGHHGPLCAICEPDYYRWQTTSPCKACPKNRDAAIAWTVGVVVGLLILCMLLYVFNTKMSSGGLRVGITAVQQLTVVLMFPVKWPESVLSLRGACISSCLVVASCLAPPTRRRRAMQ